MYILRTGNATNMKAHSEILSLRTFTGEYCKVLNINLRKWLDIPPICKKSTYTQKCMFIKIGSCDFWVDEIEWDEQV